MDTFFTSLFKDKNGPKFLQSKLTPGVNLNRGIMKQDRKLGNDQKTFCFFLFL